MAHSATASDLDPVAERLLEEGRERKGSSLLGRELVVRWVFAIGFMTAAIPLALLTPSARNPSLVLVAVLVCVFAVASRIEFEVGNGHTLPTELLLVPMLFLLPAASVPLAVAAALLLGQLPDYARRSIPWARTPVVIGNAWYSVGPALVMIAFGQPEPRWSAWGIEERVIINTHTIEGEQLLLRVGGLLAEVGTIVRSCHERWDGTGYPDRLAGEAIPLVARIVSACDAFNAMTTDRPYRKGRSPQAALAELAANRGTQFDPEVVDAITRTTSSGPAKRRASNWP